MAHSGTVLGTTASPDKLHNPAAGVLGNGLILLAAALQPPVFPSANHICAVVQHALGSGLNAWLHSGYPKFSLQLNELPQEESGTLGLGITVALLASMILWVTFRKRESMAAHQPQLLRWQIICWWVWLIFAGTVISAHLGTGRAFPRNMLPWYPLALAPLIAWFGCEQIPRFAAWKLLIPLVPLSIVPGLLLTPSRPIIPPPIIAKLARTFGASPAMLQRLNRVYHVYDDRADPFADLKQYLPPDVHVLALVSDGNEPTASWWKPYGSRRCIYLLTAADIEAALKQGAKYVVLKHSSCREYFHTSVPRWLETHHAREVKTADVRLLASKPPVRYTLAQFQANVTP